jgi:hypothetical protein
VFAALVRTTGARNDLLLEALHSLAIQLQPCVAIVIVHGTSDHYAKVSKACAKFSLAQVIHAPNNDPKRRRGYPLNVGIEHCLNKLPNIEYLFLLDDDDLVYPFFTSVMTDAFSWSDADLVYAISNRHEKDKPLAPSFPLKPYYHLLEQNFIPSNAYAIRTEALRRTGVRVDENFEYLEDWFFLLSLLQHGVTFHRLDVALSEFRTEGDGEYAYKNDLDLWKAYAARIRQHINKTQYLIAGSDLAQMAERQIAVVSPAGRFSDSSVTAGLYRRIFELEHSFSWKITGPVRALAAKVLDIRNGAKGRK